MIAAGHTVGVLDDLSTGRRSNVNQAAELFVADVRDASAVDGVIQAFQPEIVDHHAAQSEVPASVKDPVRDATVNILGGLNILMASLRGGVQKVIFISTGGALYGHPEAIPCTEEHPIRPLSPYGTSKYSFEQYLGTFHRTFELDLHGSAIRQCLRTEAGFRIPGGSAWWRCSPAACS